MSLSGLDNRYMEFRIGEQVYGVPLLMVREVIRRPEITPVPNMPSHLEGMINLRGQILAVFNIRKRLAEKPKSQSVGSPDVVIVIEDLGLNIGMSVDEVTRVIQPEGKDISPAPLRENEPAKPYVTAVIQDESELVMVLDTTTLLDLNKFKKNQMAA